MIDLLLRTHLNKNAIHDHLYADKTEFHCKNYQLMAYNGVYHLKILNDLCLNPKIKLKIIIK